MPVEYFYIRRRVGGRKRKYTRLKTNTGINLIDLVLSKAKIVFSHSFLTLKCCCFPDKVVRIHRSYPKFAGHWFPKIHKTNYSSLHNTELNLMTTNNCLKFLVI